MRRPRTLAAAADCYLFTDATPAAADGGVQLVVELTYSAAGAANLTYAETFWQAIPL